MIPHLHVVLYFPTDKLDFVKAVFKRVVEHFKLNRTDLEEVSFKDNINYLLIQRQHFCLFIISNFFSAASIKLY